MRCLPRGRDTPLQPGLAGSFLGKDLAAPGDFRARAPQKGRKMDRVQNKIAWGLHVYDGDGLTDEDEVFTYLTLPYQRDTDSDGVLDGSDNCPLWPNASQALPPWPVTSPASDPDCAGFSTTVENSAGTSPTTHCGANAWPADINNDTFSDISDIVFLTGNFGAAVPPAPARYNIAPDPPDGFVDITDVSRMVGFFGRGCSP